MRMNYRSLDGDDEINASLMAAMKATVEKMVEERLITTTQAETFLDEHIVMVAAARGGLAAWLKRRVKDLTTQKDTTAWIIVAKATSL